MYLQVKMPENGRKNVFSDKQTTNKLPLMFLDAKVLTQKVTMTFLEPVSKERRYNVCN